MQTSLAPGMLFFSPYTFYTILTRFRNRYITDTERERERKHGVTHTDLEWEWERQHRGTRDTDRVAFQTPGVQVFSFFFFFTLLY